MLWPRQAHPAGAGPRPCQEKRQRLPGPASPATPPEVASVATAGREGRQAGGARPSPAGSAFVGPWRGAGCTDGRRGRACRLETKPVRGARIGSCFACFVFLRYFLLPLLLTIRSHPRFFDYRMCAWAAYTTRCRRLLTNVAKHAATLAGSIPGIGIWAHPRTCAYTRRVISRLSRVCDKEGSVLDL